MGKLVTVEEYPKTEGTPKIVSVQNPGAPAKQPLVLLRRCLLLLLFPLALGMTAKIAQDKGQRPTEILVSQSLNRHPKHFPFAVMLATCRIGTAVLLGDGTGDVDP
jgi:hypothetical protein